MKIPKSVKVGGHILDVVQTNDCGVISSDCIGQTILAKNIIYLNESYPKSRLKEALLHEIVHNCFFDLQAEQNEALINRIGVMLYMLIMDNPKIFK